ncbi:MAG: hypothetical protein ACR2I2_10410 [Bryobacteraceae bacterium]
MAASRTGPVAAGMLFTISCMLAAQNPATATAPKRAGSRAPLAIQGQITAIRDKTVTIKTPDGYPGGPGVHARFVTLGPTFQVDVSQAPVLLPDGRKLDPVQQLLVGDWVLAVLSTSKSGAPSPNTGDVKHALFLERIVTGGGIITH